MAHDQVFLELPHFCTLDEDVSLGAKPRGETVDFGLALHQTIHHGSALFHPKDGLRGQTNRQPLASNVNYILNRKTESIDHHFCSVLPHGTPPKM
jgi:hypothetical protein